MHARPYMKILLPLGLAVLAGACGGDDNNGTPAVSEPMRFEVAATNLTAGQPFSPVAVVVHEPGYHAFTVGSPASMALEKLAEGGDNSELLAQADDQGTVSGTASGGAPIAPGGSETVAVESPAADVADQRLTIVSMLVNTNDAIAAIKGVHLSALDAGESVTVTGGSYDSGTEANTETADTMPGPAASGGAREGFNAVRDDIRDAVHAHQGVVTADDGLAGSVLDAAHRWDNPVVRVTITRVQ